MIILNPTDGYDSFFIPKTIFEMSKYVCTIFSWLLLSAFSLDAQPLQKSSSKLPRTIVTTDGELDDVDSFIRMLLYTNEYKVEGLIVSSSQWHYKGDGKGTKFTSEMDMTKQIYGERTELRWPGEQWIYDLVDAYTKVYPNLKKHSANYPTGEHLRSLIRIGNIDFEGEMEKNTEGSDFIKKKLLDDDMTPLYLQVWGGTNTIARALKSIEDEYKNTPKWNEIYQKVCKKAIIYAILDQDATYRKYISVKWSDMKIFYNSNQFWSFAYFWKRAVPQPLHYLLEGKFMTNIIHHTGPLTAMYYSYGDGNPPKGEIDDIYSSMEKAKKNMWGSFTQYDFISEGDSPAFLHLVDVGLGNLEAPHFGGWGGRLVQSETQPNRWEDGTKTAEYNPYTQKIDSAYAQVRWMEAIQNDFAARAEWCVKDFKDANHAPVVSLKHANNLTAKTNQKVSLEGRADDPDGDKLTYTWWQYEDVGTYKGKIKIQNAGQLKSSFLMPNDIKKGETIHMILAVKDQKTRPMTRYQRVIITAQ
jgi:hypothetical protein